MFRPSCFAAALIACAFASSTSNARDGDLDVSFAPPVGKVSVSFDNTNSTRRDIARAVFVRGDNYIVAGSADPALNGTQQVAVAIVDRSGNVKARHVVPTGLTFEPASEPSSTGFRAGIDGLGRVYFAGRAPARNGGSGVRLSVTRLRADFTLDTSYGTNGLAQIDAQAVAPNSNSQALDLVVSPIGAVTLGGFVRHQPGASGRADIAIARVLPTGAVDTSFAFNGVATIRFDTSTATEATATRIAIDAQGRIVIVGIARVGDSAAFNMALARLLPSGALDTTLCSSGAACGSPIGGGRRTFTFGGSLSGNDMPFALLTRPDGSILVGGASDALIVGQVTRRCVVQKILQDGRDDASFGIGGRRTVTFGTDNCNLRKLLVDSLDGIVIVGNDDAIGPGNSPRAAFIAARLDANGNQDFGFASTPQDGSTAIARIEFTAGTHNEALAADALIDREQIVFVGTRRFAGATGGTLDDLDFAVVRLKGGLRHADSFE